MYDRLGGLARCAVTGAMHSVVVYMYTQGPRDANKYKIVNKALIYFVQNYKMKKAASGPTDTHMYAYEYQSTTWETMLKVLFSFFCEHGYSINTLTTSRYDKGTYVTVLNKKFKEISEERSDFGSIPNRSAVDIALLPNSKWKVETI